MTDNGSLPDSPVRIAIPEAPERVVDQLNQEDRRPVPPQSAQRILRAQKELQEVVAIVREAMDLPSSAQLMPVGGRLYFVIPPEQEE